MQKLTWQMQLLISMVLGSVAISTLWPLFYVLVTSSRTLNDYLNNLYGIPREFTLSNFKILWDNYSLGLAARNTIEVVGISMICCLSLSSLAAFGLAKYPYRGSKYVNWAFIAVMLLPSTVLIIPIYLVLSKLQLVGHLPGLMIVYIATNIPFSVFFLRAAFKAVPDSILEAARIDGAGFFRAFRSIAMPSVLASFTTLAVLQFLGMWNELLYAYLILPDQSTRLLTPALANIGGRYTSNPPLVAAALVITATPTLVLLAFSSKYLVRGVTSGIGSS